MIRKKEFNFQTELMNNHLGLELIFLTFCHINIASLTGHVEQKNIDHLNSYTSGQLLSIRGNKYTTNLDKTTCLKIKELGLKRTLRGTRGGKNKPKIQDQNRDVHEEWLKSLPKHSIIYWKAKNTRFFLTNIQSIINKLDMVLHHMEVDKIDIGFITETWINNKID